MKSIFVRRILIIAVFLFECVNCFAGPGDIYAFKTGDGNWSFCNYRGDRITTKFEDVGSSWIVGFHKISGFAAVKQNGKWGYIDKRGVVVIPFQFDAASDFECGLAPAKYNGKWGLINEAGNPVLQPQYDGILWDTLGDYWYLWSGENRGIADKTGKIIVAPQFESIGSYGEGLIPVKRGGKYGYIDMLGNLSIGFKYENAGRFYNGIATVQVDGKWGFIDKTGELVDSPRYSATDRDLPFNEGLAYVHTDDGFGYIDKTGKWVIAPQAGWGSSFSDGLAAVYVNNKFGYIDKTGNFIIYPMFKSARDFENGIAAVQDENGLWGLINRSGIYVVTPQFEMISSEQDGLRWVEVKQSPYFKERQYKFIDRSGNIYDDIEKALFALNHGN